MNTEKKNKPSRLKQAWTRVKDSFKRFWHAFVVAARGQAEPLPKEMGTARKIGIYATGTLTVLFYLLAAVPLLAADKLEDFQTWLASFVVPIAEPQPGNS